MVNDDERTATETTLDPARRTWRFTPKSVFGSMPAGPWDDEPDKVQWVDRATDLDCLMVRNHQGAWCGYVGVPQHHRLYRQPYHIIPADVHGGLTFSELCAPDERFDAICHIAEPGREQKPWWFGFDCAHSGDLVPGILAIMNAAELAIARRSLKALSGTMASRDVYRDETYTRNEVTSLARQLQALDRGSVVVDGELWPVRPAGR